MAFVPTTSFWPAQAEAQVRPSTTSTGSLSVPVTSNNTDFAGTFNIKSFAVQGGQLVALGTLVGTVTDPNGVVRTVLTSIAMPVDTAASGGGGGSTACDILHLVLAPLDLDLLGLQIHLDQVVLDIVAQPRPGNLLGNLLCAIVGLLDPLGPLSQLALLLNQLLALLGG